MTRRNIKKSYWNRRNVGDEEDVNDKMTLQDNDNIDLDYGDKVD